MIKAYKLFTGEDGHSHFQEGTISEDEIFKSAGVKFKETEPGADMDWHTAPTTQYVLTLEGSLFFTVFNDKSFTLNAGDVLIATDITGTGHKWKMLGDKPWKRAYVLFAEGTETAFLPDNLAIY